ncbi:MAG TPA: GNAT family N-acetyltransferase [Candidatus Dojkabacteria bacterium]|jgi:ribosomal protein S18 acetylase RimI-like enzyme
MNNLKIELAKPADAEEVYELFKTTWLDTYVNEKHGITKEDILSKYPESKRKSTIVKYAKFYENMNKDIEKSETVVWLAKNDSQVVGLVSIDRKVPIQIGAVYVLPEFQRQGIGKQLIEYILKFLGNKVITINVASYNERAIKFYEKYGFEVHNIIKDSSGELPTGKIIPEVQMIKK